MRSNILLCTFFICCIACTNERTLSFADLVDIKQIEKVEMRNNSGTFLLSQSQLKQFKEQIATMSYDPNMSAKVGAINMTLTIAGQEHLLSTATHGDYVEAHNSIVGTSMESIEGKAWIYFNTNGINFDNFKEEYVNDHLSTSI